MVKSTLLQRHVRPSLYSSTLPRRIWHLTQLIVYIAIFGSVSYMCTAGITEERLRITAPVLLICLSLSFSFFPASVHFFGSFTLHPWPELPILRTRASPEEMVHIVEEMIDTICGGRLPTCVKAKQYLTEDFALYLADPESVVTNFFSMGHRCSIAVLLETCAWFICVSYGYSGYKVPGKLWSVSFPLMLVWCLIQHLLIEYQLTMVSYLWRMSKMASDIREQCMCIVSEKGSVNDDMLAEVIGSLLGKFEKEESDAKDLHRIIRESIGDAQCWTWREHSCLRTDGTGLNWVLELSRGCEERICLEK